MASAISFPDDNNITYRFVDWSELGDSAYDLAAKILAAESRFDRIVSLATGGFTLSKAMKDYLNIQKISNLHISFYTGIGITAKSPTITQGLSADMHGEKVLIFDDINDSGETIKVSRAEVEGRGAAKIVTATIFQKPVTRFPSDYYSAETSDWIIFPDEIRETITLLNTKWQGKGLSDPEIRQRLLDIGFSGRHLAIVL